MSPREWERVKDVFETALTRQEADRAEYVAVACGGDDSLRSEVERLLAGHDRAGSFLEQSPSVPSELKLVEAPGEEDIRIGHTLSHYEIAAKLGQGGMGTVYQAMDLQLRRPVAIKVLRRLRLRDVDPDRRFVREARAASALNHPHICHVHEIGEDAGVRFIVMEYIEGQTLEAAIADRPMEISEIVRFGTQAAEALAEAHAQGIIHRDIKPSNLMIGPRDELKVLDFGLAKVRSDLEAGATPSSQSSLSSPGVLIGTVQYMSPEQLLGQEIDRRTDIFSLGLVLHEMANGRPTFQGRTPAETIGEILHAKPEPIARWPELDRIARKCLEKARERRYQSASEVAAELRKIGQGKAFNRKGVLITTVAIVLVTALALAAGLSRLVGPVVRLDPVNSRRSSLPRTPSSVWDHLKFEKIAALGDPAPGGGAFTHDFEPWGLNGRGDLLFVSDIDSVGGEGIFLLSKSAGLQALARPDWPAPGGGVFTAGVPAGAQMNDAGDVVFGFGIKPWSPPELKGSNRMGVYRYSHADRKLSAVVIPGITIAPGFGVFQSTPGRASLNNLGDIAFTGLVRTTAGSSPSNELGVGVFLVGRDTRISKVVAPGDPEPRGGTFDFAASPSINDAGDIAFIGHLAGEECAQESRHVIKAVDCLISIFLKRAGNPAIEPIAYPGKQTLPNVILRNLMGPVLNNRDDLVFVGELTPRSGVRGVRTAHGIFLYSAGRITAIALPGDTMPDGREIATVNPSQTTGCYSLNNRGDITFSAALENGESGLYLYSKGSLHLIAGTGTVIPNIGTVTGISNRSFEEILNDSGQILFSARMTDGKTVLLLATPQPVEPAAPDKPVTP